MELGELLLTSKWSVKISDNGAPLVNNSAHNAHQFETFKEEMKCLCQ